MQYLIFAALVAYTQAVAIGVAAPLGYPAVAKVVAPEPFDAHPQYHFNYAVADATTGDQKTQEESRDGGIPTFHKQKNSNLKLFPSLIFQMS